MSGTPIKNAKLKKKKMSNVRAPNTCIPGTYVIMRRRMYVWRSFQSWVYINHSICRTQKLAYFVRNNFRNTNTVICTKTKLKRNYTMNTQHSKHQAPHTQHTHYSSSNTNKYKTQNIKLIFFFQHEASNTQQQKTTKHQFTSTPTQTHNANPHKNTIFTIRNIQLFFFVSFLINHFMVNTSPSKG